MPVDVALMAEPPAPGLQMRQVDHLRLLSVSPWRLMHTMLKG